MSDQPNILLIMADQMVPFLTGAYGHPVVQTPHLSRLAREGVRFDAAYTPCAVCGPARAALMTGKYVSTIGAWDNGTALPVDQPTFAHYLTNAGYDAVLSGKMHFVGPDQLHGFRQRFNTNIYPADFAWTPVRGEAQQSARSHALQYVGEAVHVGRWSQFLEFDEEAHFHALGYLRAQGAAMQEGEHTNPFFLCASFHHPHEPFWPPQPYWDRYAGAEIALPDFPDDLEASYSQLDRWLNVFHGVAKATALRDPESLRRLRRAYYALVTYIDDKVGELLAAVEANGFLDNTVIVFCSDHGDMLGEKGMVQKRTFYEWSSRVPLIVRMPDGAGAGTQRPEPVNLIDLLPTFLDLAGVESRLPHDGASLMPLIVGQAQPDRLTFAEYHAQGTHAPGFMVRQRQYKYVFIHEHGDQLFDLEKDPGEWRNLAGDPRYADVVAGMKAHILSRFDPAAIDAAVTDSIRRRRLIQPAMQANRTRWDHDHHFDPARSLVDRYLP